MGHDDHDELSHVSAEEKGLLATCMLVAGIEAYRACRNPVLGIPAAVAAGLVGGLATALILGIRPRTYAWMLGCEGRNRPR